MDDNDTSGGGGGGDDDERSLTSTEREQEQIPADDLCAKIITILQQKKTFPNRTRNKTDELVRAFLQNLEDDIHDMLCEKYVGGEEYDGLDSSLDTEAEVETVVRFFPELLSRRKDIVDTVDAEDEGDYPIGCISYMHYTNGNWWCNFKAAPFIPLLIRLAIEFSRFDEESRGGLLMEHNDGKNCIHNLTLSSNSVYGEDHHGLVDETFLQVLIQLRQMGLLKKEDIQTYGLLNRLCNQDYFAENRFRFLVEWDPISLTDTDFFSCLPLHNAANHTAVRRFRLVFEYGIRYYPKKIGISLLFQKDDFSRTPFQMACSNVDLGYEYAMKAIEDSLCNNVTGPYNVVDALITAAIDDYVHLDCVYFLLRREPDVLVKLLSTSTTSVISEDSSTNDINSNSNNNNNNNRNSKKRKSKGKRKRKRKRGS